MTSYNPWSGSASPGPAVPFSVSADVLFLVLLEASTRRVAGAPPSRSGPTAVRSLRLSVRPPNISTSQVGAGAHPVPAAVLPFALLSSLQQTLDLSTETFVDSLHVLCVSAWFQIRAATSTESPPSTDNTVLSLSDLSHVDV